MRILGRLISIALLFSLLLLVVGVVAAQTDYAHEKLARWIEKKTDGALKIGKIEGILPFWAHLHAVHYHTDTLGAALDEVKISFSPASLLYGRLAIVDLLISRAVVNSTGKEWPSFPLPIDIHAFKIEHLSYNGLEDLKVSGMAELQDHFFLQIALTHPRLPGEVRATVEADPENGVVNTLAHFKQDDNSAVWVSGAYRWNSQTFAGTWHGHKEGFKLNGVLEIDLTASQMIATGKLLDRPFVVRADLKQQPGPVVFNYGDQHWKLAGKFDLNTQILNFHLFARDITWKQTYVPEIVMDGTYHNQALNFSLSLPDFTVLDPAYEVFPKVRLSLDGSATLDKVTANGMIEGLCEQPFTLALELPLSINLTAFQADIDEEAPFFMRICGHGSIDPILEFLENASLIARGNIDLDLQASGTWKAPQLSGHLTYTDGRIESFTTGAIFRDIHMEMEGVGQSLQIRSLIAHDVGKGDLAGSGYILWDPINDFPFSFHLFASRYLILGVDPLTITVNAEVVISGSTQGMTIAGNAALVEGHLAIPSDLPVQVPSVEVCYINPIAALKPEEELPRKTIPVHWDLTLNADRHFYIDGRGLDSEWSGTLHITGEQKDFQFNGKLRLVQGRFDIINQTFDLVHGRIRIQGLEPKDIFVDLKGDYELPNLTASIIVIGSLDSTHISFCSNPPMNTNQILSWILFQQDINELTPMQACRLASLLVSLSGKYSGPKTFDKIKDKLGIDVFSITDCDIDSADLTFQVGKYLSQGTFVGVNKSISGNFDSVLIQTRLFRNFYLEADYGGSLNSFTPNGGKGILKWYKTY